VSVHAGSAREVDDHFHSSLLLVTRCNFSVTDLWMQRFWKSCIFHKMSFLLYKKAMSWVNYAVHLLKECNLLATIASNR
jgi:hypothetical protein